LGGSSPELTSAVVVKPAHIGHVKQMKQLESKLEYTFKRQGLLELALTHSSVAGGRGQQNQSNAQSNERLEFLGDRVLGLTIAELVYSTFPDEPEGHLARRFTALVRREALAVIGGKLGIIEHLNLSQSERDAATEKAKDSIVADACEALIAAIYLDGGYEAASKFILRHWTALMDTDLSPPMDAKTALQEWGQGRGMPLPTYVETDREGPAHAPMFTVKVSMNDGQEAIGHGKSKRSAEQEAAKHLLEQLEPTNDR
jgi:ribonuclease III